MILLEEKEKRNGSGFQQFWGLAGAIGLVRTKLTGTQDLENGQPTKDAIARVMGICYKVIASQEDPSMAIALHKANDEVCFYFCVCVWGSREVVGLCWLTWDFCSHHFRRLDRGGLRIRLSWMGLRICRLGRLMICGISI